MTRKTDPANFYPLNTAENAHMAYHINDNVRTYIM